MNYEQSFLPRFLFVLVKLRTNEVWLGSIAAKLIRKQFEVDGTYTPWETFRRGRLLLYVDGKTEPWCMAPRIDEYELEWIIGIVTVGQSGSKRIHGQKCVHFHAITLK